MASELDRLNFDPRTQSMPTGGYSGLGGDATDYSAIKTAAEAEAQKLRDRVAADMQAAKDLPEIQAALLVNFRAALHALASDNDHSMQWLRQRTQDTRSQAGQALDDAEASAAEALQRVRAVVLKATSTAPASGQDAVLQELQLTNAWASVRQILEAAALQADPLQAIELATQSTGSDPIKRAAIRRFAPDWVTAQYAAQPQYARQRILEALFAGLDAAELPSMSATQKAGRAILAECERGTARLRMNSSACRNEISGKSTAPVLAGWADGSSIPTGYSGPAADRLMAPGGVNDFQVGEGAQRWAREARQSYPYLFIGANNAGSTGPRGIRFQ